MGHPKTRAARRSSKYEHEIEKDFFGNVSGEDRHKPNKHNLIYCNASRKEKLQFETKESACRYLEFNSDKIAKENGYAPTRAYWCSNCCCWHVTSKPKRHNS